MKKDNKITIRSSAAEYLTFVAIGQHRGSDIKTTVFCLGGGSWSFFTIPGSRNIFRNFNNLTNLKLGIHIYFI